MVPPTLLHPPRGLARPDVVSEEMAERLYEDDLQIKLDAAVNSVKEGDYAVARFELRGAILLLDEMERAFQPAPVTCRPTA